MPNTEIRLWNDRKTLPGTEEPFQPYLKSYLLPGDTVRGCVIVFPGGGYSNRAGHEGAPVAERFNRLGFHAVVVEYRVAPYRYPAPQEDALRAVRIVRGHAAEWNIDPTKIAVLGFSAGGHLACSAGIVYDQIPAAAGDALDTVSARPDAMILCYPVITCRDKLAHFGSFENLLGTKDRTQFPACSWEEHVTDSTPPTFLWHTAEDSAVPVENSLLFSLALQKHKIPFELHVFPYGHHGLGLGTKEEYAEMRVWPELAGTWLRKMGF